MEHGFARMRHGFLSVEYDILKVIICGKNFAKWRSPLKICENLLNLWQKAKRSEGLPKKSVAISAICGKTFAKRRITIKICGKKAEGVKKISVKICVICGKKLREAKTNAHSMWQSNKSEAKKKPPVQLTRPGGKTPKNQMKTIFKSISETL